MGFLGRCFARGSFVSSSLGVFMTFPLVMTGKGWDGSPRQAEHGSIIVIHMPERGFRDWCLRGVDCFC